MNDKYDLWNCNTFGETILISVFAAYTNSFSMQKLCRNKQQLF